MINRLTRLLSLGVLVLFIGSCNAVKPISLRPIAAPPSRYQAVGVDSSQVEMPTWRQVFLDSTLVALIDTALANNLNRKIALANIQQAEAELLRARAPQLPQVQALLAGGAERFGDYTMNGVGNFDLNRSENVPPDRRVPNPVTDVFVGFRSAWEIDLWGRLKALRQGAAARVLATAEAEQWLRTNLVAGVATTYFELLALDAEIQVAEQNIALQQIALATVEAQKAAGRATELAVKQFQAQIFNTRALTLQLRQRVVQVENALRILLGSYSHPVTRGLPLMTQVLPNRFSTGLPAQLVWNRPDLRQAERLLNAAQFEGYAARAGLLPNLILTPHLGFQAFRPGVLFLPESAALGLLGGISGPIFNRRNLLAERNLRNAAEQSAWFNYQNSLIVAFTEVQNELAQYANLAAALPLKSAEVQALEEAVQTSNDLYVAGYANYLEVITAQRSALAAAIELQELRKNQFINLINLYRALGGG